MAGDRYLTSGRETKTTPGIVILVVLYITTIYGLKSEMISEYFQWMIPFDIFASFAVLMYYQKHWNLKALMFLVITYCAAMTILIIGVNTCSLKDARGIVFGPLKFGGVLGPKLFQVPLIIGVLWTTLIYCVGILLRELNMKKFQKVMLGSLMIVLFDITLEPIARQTGMWDWFTKKDPLSNYRPVPLQNYFTWFLFCIPMLYYFFNAKAKLRNSIAVSLFLLVFFYYVFMNITR